VVNDGRELDVVRHFAAKMDDERDLTQIAGNYFTSVVDIDERVEESLRGGETVSYKARRAVAQGTTLLVVRLRFMDEMLHSIEMMAHPADPDRSELAFMPDEFFTWFVPAAETVRKEEIAALETELRQAQESMRAVHQQVAIAAPLQQSPGENALVAVRKAADGINERMKAMVAVAEQRREVLATHMNSMKCLDKVLGRYREEYGVAAMAMISDQFAFAEQTRAGMHSLSFFTGEGVTVETLRQGAPAAADAPLTLYQSLLYLDEELAVNLLSHGFDYRSLPELGNILQDMTLVERMIPAARGAVLVRVRREGVQYIPIQTLGDILLNAAMNVENETTYLLVRNGENVHLVQSEVTSGETRHLFPARKEIDDIFKTMGREIRPEHLEYSTAKDAFEKRTVFYRRLVIMLWGLDERLSLFGEFHAQGDYDGWFDDRFHMERLVYVHDAEDVIEHAQQGFAEWADEKNRHVQLGSRLAVDWGDFFNDESAPEGFEYRRSGVYQVWYPLEKYAIQAVEKADDALVLRTKTVYGQYGSGKQKPFKVRVAEGLSPSAGLCLDFVERSELQYFLNSRRERRKYAGFLGMYRMVDEHLRIEEETQGRTLADLAERMTHSGLGPEAASMALRRAVALWRAQNGGKLIGGPGWKPNMSNLILDMAYTISGARNDLLARVRRDIPGVVPLELRIDGKGRLLLYRELAAGEGFRGLEHFDKAWVARTVLKIGRDGTVSEIGAPEVTYLHNPDFERQSYRESSRVFRRYDREIALCADADAASQWRDAKQPDWFMPEQARSIVAAVDYDAELALQALSPTVVRERLWQTLRYGTYRYERHDRVDRGRVILPLAIVRSHNGFGMLQLSARGTDVYASFGPAMEAEAAITARRVEDPTDELARIARTALQYGPDALPFVFEIVWSEFDRARPGINFVTANPAVTKRGDHVDVRRAKMDEAGENIPFSSLEEALDDHVTNATRRKDDNGFDLRFMNEGSRRVGEAYFAICRDKKTGRYR
jgi:DNA-binding transcriptional regulator GbsR (MarR family)